MFSGYEGFYFSHKGLNRVIGLITDFVFAKARALCDCLYLKPTNI